MEATALTARGRERARLVELWIERNDRRPRQHCNGVGQRMQDLRCEDRDDRAGALEATTRFCKAVDHYLDLCVDRRTDQVNGGRIDRRGECRPPVKELAQRLSGQ